MGFRTGILVLFWAACAPAFAAQEPSASLTLTQAIAMVLERNPQLQAGTFDARAAAARIRQQQQTTPWSLGVDVENFAGTGRRRGTDSVETTLSLGRVLELGDKPEKRGQVARYEAGLLRHERDAVRLDLLAETARRYLNIARVQAERDLAQDRVDLLQLTLKAVEQRIRAGKSPTAQRSRVDIDLGRAELALEETEHLIRVARRRLAALWGAFDPGFETVRAELLQLSPEPDFDDLEQRLDNNPLLARLATAERLAEARIRLARAARRADVDVRAGIKQFADTDDAGFALSVRVPLGSQTRARPYEAEAQALAAKEPLLAQDQRLALRVTLYELHQELLHSRDRVQSLRDRIMPAARRTLKDYREGYGLGRYSLLELIEAQQRLLQARLELIDAAVAHHATFIEIDRLVGAAAPAGEMQ